MDLILFVTSFVFSLVFLVLGFVKKAPVLTIIGSLTLMLTGIFLLTTNLTSITTSYIYDSVSNSTVKITNESMSATESSVPVGIILSIFSILMLLYSGKVWLYGEAEEGG
jgi:hypothetical protein